MRYNFHPGDIIDYDYIIEKPSDIGEPSGNFKATWKYRFTVDSSSNDLFHISMKLIGFYSGGAWITGLENLVDRNNPASYNQMMNIYNDEISRPIRFKMDTAGRITEMTGQDSLLLLAEEQAARDPSFRDNNNYWMFRVRYSREFYSYLIHEFFPEINFTEPDTACLNCREKSLCRINSWSPFAGVKDHMKKFQINRDYEFRKGNQVYEIFNQQDLNSKTTMIWDTKAEIPVSMKSVGLPPDVILSELISEGSIAMKMMEISIVNTSITGINDKKVHITGKFINHGDRNIMVILPGNTISNRRLPVNPDTSGSFILDFDLDLPAGIVDIYYTRPGAYLWVSPGNPDQVRIFTRPGDSIDFTADLGDPRTLRFDCRISQEQFMLNMFSQNFPPRDPEKSILTTMNNIELLDHHKSRLDPGFVQFMEFENRYTLLSHEAEVFSRTNPNGKTRKPPVSLGVLIEALGNPDGYKSDAYKEFICDFSDAYRASQVVNTKHRGEIVLDLSTAMLSGWDRYWYLASLAEQDLGLFWSRGYDLLYHRFKTEYPGTEFLNQLTVKYKRTEKGRLGNPFPNILFRDYKSKQYSVDDFLGRDWCIFNLYSYKEMDEFLTRWIGSYEKKYPGRLTFVLPTHQCSQQEIDSLAKKGGGKPVVLAINLDCEAISFLESLPSRLIFVDSGGRIAGYSYFRSGSTTNYLTWPEVQYSSDKTINLTAFWYSLGGAFMLSVIIILAIRLRSRQKEKQLLLKRRMAQLEVDAVRSRMNPHFLFNALSSIQNLINRKQVEEANLYLARFGELVRTILYQSTKPAIGLNEEIDMIRNYLQLEQLRFPFTYDIQVEPGIDPFAVEVPPLLIQPHVENAVIHGIAALGKEGRIDIRFSVGHNHLICTVRDNGPGYRPGTGTGNGGLGQGWKLTHQRIRLLKEQYGDDISVEIEDPATVIGDNKDNTGTTVIFNLPMQKSA